WPDDPFVVVNMSMWESIEALREFAYNSNHRELLRDKAKWFGKMEKPSGCMWWVPNGHIPTVAEGRERLMHYQEHGASSYAFWFTQRFPVPAQAEASA